MNPDRRTFFKAGTGSLGALSLGMLSCADSGRAPETAIPIDKTIRPLGIYLANHLQDTGMHTWGIDRWKRDIRDLKAMGAECIWYLPIQFGQRSVVDFAPGAPYWELQKSICTAIADEGLEVGIAIGYNDVFPETLEEHPSWQAKYGKYGMEQAHACPSQPEALKEIMRLRERVFSEIPRIDYVLCPITDYGGCACEKCAPLPETYLRVFSEQTAVCRTFHPGVKIVAAGWGIDLNEEDMLRGLIRQAEWIDYVAEIPRGVKPIMKFYMDPEITMAGGWGSYGPCPLLSLIRRSYREEYGYISGSVTYSEGIHDDINRFAVLAFARDPNRSVIDVASQYTEEWLHLTGGDVRSVAEVIAGLGNGIGVQLGAYVHPDDGVDNPRADERLNVLIDVRKHAPALSDNYRYWLLHFRAVYESLSVTEGKIDIDTLLKEIGTAREAFRRLEPEYGLFLDQKSRWSKPELSPWNWPRTFHHAWNRENGFIR